MILFAGILTCDDFDLYYHGERCTSDQAQSLTCPFCGDMGFVPLFLNKSSSSDSSTQNIDFFQHLQIKHANDQHSCGIICPICATTVNGDPNQVTTDLISHIANNHQSPQVNTTLSVDQERNTYSRQLLSTRDCDVGVGSRIRNNFRRGSLRLPSRRSGMGRGSGALRQHFVLDTSTGLRTVVSGHDSIADLLTQLPIARRLAIVNSNRHNTNNSLPSSSSTTNRQNLNRSQYERECPYETIHTHQSKHVQQITPIANVIPPTENDTLDSFFSSVLLIDPSTSSHQNLTQNVTQQSIPVTEIPAMANIDNNSSRLWQLLDKFNAPSAMQSSPTVVESSKEKMNFAQSILISSLTYSMNDK